jgi:hypothetical protein
MGVTVNAALMSFVSVRVQSNDDDVQSSRPLLSLLLVYNFHLPDASTYLLEALLGVMGCKS